MSTADAVRAVFGVLLAVAGLLGGSYLLFGRIGFLAMLALVAGIMLVGAALGDSEEHGQTS